MSWSLGEIRALAVKAARGGGLPLHICEDAGRAVHWLQAADMPGVEVLAQYLVLLEQKDQNYDKSRCPFERGIWLANDYKAEENLGAIRFPLLVLPFLALSRKSNFRFALGDASLIVSRDGAAYTAAREALMVAEAECDFVSYDALVDTQPVNRVGENEEPSVNVLEYFAALQSGPTANIGDDNGEEPGAVDTNTFESKLTA